MSSYSLKKSSRRPSSSKRRIQSILSGVGDSFIRGVSVGVVGRNLWIIKKHVDHFDPEVILTSGNAQGIEQGAYPTVRTVGVNLKLDF